MDAVNPITFEVGTEIEFQQVASALEEMGIPFTFKKNADTAFPVLGLNKAFAHITLAKQYEKEVRDIFPDLFEIPEEPPAQKNPPPGTTKKKRHWLIPLLVGYSVLSTVLWMKYYYIHSQSEESKNYVYHWNLDNTSLSLIGKKGLTTWTEFIDRNYDQNFEEVKAYAKDGTLISISLDEDEDGFHDDFRSLSTKGEITSQMIDDNSDGIFEKMMLITQNKDTLRFTDKDLDGFWEVVK